MRYLLLLLLFPLAAAAEQVAVATDGGDAIELHDRLHNKCPAGLGEARYIFAPQKNGRPVDGCWKYLPDRGGVAIVFEDGDALLVPVDKFVWKIGKRPLTI